MIDFLYIVYFFLISNLCFKYGLRIIYPSKVRLMLFLISNPCFKYGLRIILPFKSKINVIDYRERAHSVVAVKSLVATPVKEPFTLSTKTGTGRR